MALQLPTAAFSAALLVLAASLTLGPAESPVYAGPVQPVDANFFGMHIHRAGAGTEWPPVSFGAWRLWDAHISWPEVEPEPGKWDFALLDRYVEIAAQHHVEILLPLGLTPAWASRRPNEPSAYSKGNASPPRRIADWEEYVRTVATRYRGKIHEYEIWNEPNVPGTFTGSPREMLELSRTAYGALKSVDPAITVVSPSATADDGIPWLNSYLTAGGCAYADVVGYHFYVTPKAPEAMIPLIEKVKASLRSHGCEGRPLWNTESGWAEPKHFQSAEAAAYLMRAYLLNWLMGVQRCYWYAWDNHNWSTLDLSSRADGRITAAGAAYGVVRAWTVDNILRACSRSRSGLWTCEIVRNGDVRRVLWSDGDSQSFNPPSSWNARTLTRWNGEVTPAATHLFVGTAPLLLSR
jgi:hypothetical protein